MKSEITIFCSNEAELREFVQRLLSEPAQPRMEVVIQTPVTLDTAPRTDTTKPARKPRADAGKPRGPYKTTGADAGTTASSTPGTTPAAGAVGGDPVTTESPPATPTAAASAPTISAAPAAEGNANGSPSVAGNPGPAPAAAEPTEADAKAAMGRINKTEGLGMPACIDFLATFGVNRITLLPKEKYAEFIKAADALVAAHKEKK